MANVTPSHQLEDWSAWMCTRFANCQALPPLFERFLWALTQMDIWHRGYHISKKFHLAWNKWYNMKSPKKCSASYVTWSPGLFESADWQSEGTAPWKQPEGLASLGREKTHNVANPACPLFVLSHYCSALPYFCHPTPNSVYPYLCWCSEIRAGLSRIVAPFLRSSAPPVSCPSLRTHKRVFFLPSRETPQQFMRQRERYLLNCRNYDEIGCRVLSFFLFSFWQVAQLSRLFLNVLKGTSEEKVFFYAFQPQLGVLIRKREGVRKCDKALSS